MTDDVQYMTQQKLDNLKAELDELENEKTPAIAKRIDEAKQMGDLSENAEYHAARDEMSWAKSRVIELKNLLDNAEIISEGKSSFVQIGSTVTVKINGKEKDYTIVGAQEADPVSGKISNESPLGSAFLGREKNEEIQVTLPSGVQVYKIVDIK
ncbi:TPA: transcription elongation factor GreA [Candidatus Magasanikbacteria bacterium]|nr:MAG: transcription elongation factor GreA [Candidatus Magasanikbacteria bacterium RIFOXYD12_FULL_33_17]HAO52084.1 transcription elongation factor GreA [Candidatus Magasanikbacteria bacterium]